MSLLLKVKINYDLFSELIIFLFLKSIFCTLNYRANSRSSLLYISIVIPTYKSHNIIMSARVYFIKRVKDRKDVYIMSLQDEVNSVRILQFFCFTKYWTPMVIETPCPKSNKLDGWQIKDKRLLIFVKQLLIWHWFYIEYKQFLSIMLQP